jgi:hypothetical protein
LPRFFSFSDNGAASGKCEEFRAEGVFQKIRAAIGMPERSDRRKAAGVTVASSNLENRNFSH